MSAENWMDGDDAWNTPGDWSAGLPTSASDVSIADGDPLIDAAVPAVTVHSVTITGGALNLENGAALSVASWSLVDAGITTIAENLSYAGKFVAGQTSTLVIDDGDTLTLTGASTLDGVMNGAGALTLDGGAMKISLAAALSVATWSITGAGTSATIAKTLAYMGLFSEGATSTLSISARRQALRRDGAAAGEIPLLA